MNTINNYTKVCLVCYTDVINKVASENNVNATKTVNEATVY